MIFAESIKNMTVTTSTQALRSVCMLCVTPAIPQYEPQSP